MLIAKSNEHLQEWNFEEKKAAKAEVEKLSSVKALESVSKGMLWHDFWKTRTQSVLQMLIAIAIAEGIQGLGGSDPVDP